MATQRPTRRQLEVLRAYIRAESVAAAAYELGIGETTVRQQLSGLYRRTSCMNAAQAANWLGLGDRESRNATTSVGLLGELHPAFDRALRKRMGNDRDATNPISGRARVEPVADGRFKGCPSRHVATASSPVRAAAVLCGCVV